MADDVAVGRKVVPFIENACYDVKQVARILNRSEKYVRNACNQQLIHARKERAGYLISGWQIRQFIEGRCEIL